MKYLSIFSKYASLLWLLLLPVQNAIIVTVLIVFLDLVLGVSASLKEGYRISSRSLRRTVSKILVYEITIILAYVIEAYMIDYPLLKAATGLIGIVEGKSCLENLYRLTKVDLLKIIIDKFQLVYDTVKPSSSKDTTKTYKGKKRED